MMSVKKWGLTLVVLGLIGILGSPLKAFEGFQDEWEEIRSFPLREPTEGWRALLDPKWEDLLSEEDRTQEAQDRDSGPTLNSVRRDPDPWQSHSEWLCFDSSSISVERGEVYYSDRWKKVPEWVASIEGRNFIMSLGPETNYDYDRIEARWEELLQGSTAVCVYAAYLQEEEDFSLWYLTAVKTEKGYWREAEEEGVSEDPQESDSPPPQVAEENESGKVWGSGFERHH